MPAKALTARTAARATPTPSRRRRPARTAQSEELASVDLVPTTGGDREDQAGSEPAARAQQSTPQLVQ